MTMRKPWFGSLAAALVFGASFIPAHACGACGCTLNSDWASQGFTTSAGFRLDLRQDYFNQNQLRAGTSAPSRSDFQFPNDQEIQQETINRNTTFALDYVASADWGFNLMIPYFNRFHASIAAGDTDASTSHRDGLGDIRVTGRYQGFLDDHSLGVQVGVKLPNGAFDQNFSDGPQAGNPLDRGLQLGTGTTDVLLGVYKYGELAMDWSYFSQAIVQVATNTRDEFRPGNSLNANVGVRFTGNPGVTPHIQVNVRAEERESGANADVPNSGATLTYLSPGLTFQAGAKMQIFAFVQVPILQRVNGLQLEPKSSASVGLHYAF